MAECDCLERGEDDLGGVKSRGGCSTGGSWTADVVNSAAAAAAAGVCEEWEVCEVCEA